MQHCAFINPQQARWRWPLVLALSILATVASPLRAQTGFTGAFDFANFTFTSGGTAATYTADATTLSVSGSMNGSYVPSLTSLLATIDGAYTISFSWTYSTTDIAVGYDPAGYIDDGQEIQLPDSSLPPTPQSGTTSFIFLGGTFGIYSQSDNWRVRSQDGRSTLTITDFTYTPFTVLTPVWTGADSSSWNDNANWENGVPSNNTRNVQFNQSSQTAVVVDIPATLGGLTFASDASAYDFTITTASVFTLNRTGIDNQSSETQSFLVEGLMQFIGTASAGDAEFTLNNGTLEFFGTSTAGTSIIHNDYSGSLLFYNDSTAGDATLNLGNAGNFFHEWSSAGNATINLAGNLNFIDQSTSANATINVEGGLYYYNTTRADGTTVNLIGYGSLDISMTDSELVMGSITGSQNSSILLGASNLILGGLNSNMVIASTISDGGFNPLYGGSLTKVGTGDLTLSAANSFTGGLRIEGGRIIATNIDALGDGSVTLAGGNLTLAGNQNRNFGNTTVITENTTITSDRTTNGSGTTHTLGQLSIGNDTLSVARGTRVTSGTAGISFGATTITANGATFSPATGTRLTLASVTGTNRSFTVTGAGDTTITGGITTGTGSLTKHGSGILTLSGPSTYSGGTSIDAGIVSVRHNSALGTGAVRVSASLSVSQGFRISNTVILSGGIYTQNVAASTNLAGLLTSTSSFVGNNPDTTMTLLAGTASQATGLSASFSAGLEDEVASDILTFHGLPDLGNGRTDIFVLQLSMTSIEDGSYLGWLSSGEWVNAIEGNFNNNALTAQQDYQGTFAQFQTTYGSTLANYVGAWGTTGTSVWAVLNHNSDFAILHPIPEPSTWLLIALSATTLLFLRRRPR
jgi:autotransporter-associated beta strand protein